jgi:hypothetical protein
LFWRDGWAGGRLEEQILEISAFSLKLLADSLMLAIEVSGSSRNSQMTIRPSGVLGREKNESRAASLRAFKLRV